MKIKLSKYRKVVSTFTWLEITGIIGFFASVFIFSQVGTTTIPFGVVNYTFPFTTIALIEAIIVMVIIIPLTRFLILLRHHRKAKLH